MITPYEPKQDIEPYPVTVLDIETNRVGDCIGVGMAWYQRGEILYHDFPDWMAWYEKYRDIYRNADRDTRRRLRQIYAHNGARFDWLHFAIWAKENNLLSDLACVQSGSMVHGMNLALRIAGERFILRLRDSIRLLPTSLKVITSTFGVASPKLDLDNLLPEDVKSQNPSLFWTYLRHDVIGLQQVLTKFWQMLYDLEGSIGQLPMTLPSLAMRLFRKQLPYPIMTSRSLSLTTLERSSYFGGRTECFMPGEYKNVRVYDINSQYPYAMLSGQYPVSYTGRWTRSFNADELGIYEASFQLPKHIIPCLPVLADSALQFPEFGRGFYTSVELNLALSLGADIQIHDGYVYDNVASPFTEFVSTWYGIRKESIANENEGLAYTCKILMNSLYGKFGQSEFGYSIEIPTPEKMQHLIETKADFREVGECILLGRDRPSETTFPAIASFVTSYARVVLYNHMRVARELGNDIVYCDTDSLHLINGSELPVSPELGDLKLEYEGHGLYIGKKLYTLSDIGKVKAKGIGHSAAMELSLEDFRAMLAGASRSMTFPVFPSPLEVLSGARRPAVQFTRTRRIRRTAYPIVR